MNNFYSCLNDCIDHFVSIESQKALLKSATFSLVSSFAIHLTLGSQSPVRQAYITATLAMLACSAHTLTIPIFEKIRREYGFPCCGGSSIIEKVRLLVIALSAQAIATSLTHSQLSIRKKLLIIAIGTLLTSKSNNSNDNAIYRDGNARYWLI